MSGTTRAGVVTSATRRGGVAGRSAPVAATRGGASSPSAPGRGRVEVPPPPHRRWAEPTHAPSFAASPTDAESMTRATDSGRVWMTDSHTTPRVGSSSMSSRSTSRGTRIHLSHWPKPPVLTTSGTLTFKIQRLGASLNECFKRRLRQKHQDSCVEQQRRNRTRQKPRPPSSASTAPPGVARRRPRRRRAAPVEPSPSSAAASRLGHSPVTCEGLGCTRHHGPPRRRHGCRPSEERARPTRLRRPGRGRRRILPGRMTGGASPRPIAAGAPP